MTAFRQIFEVARRDFLQRARSKAFLAITLLTVGAILVLAPFLASAVQDSPPMVIGLVGETPDGLADRIATVSGALEVNTEVRTFDSKSAAEAALTDGDIRGLVVDGSLVEFQSETSEWLVTVVNAAVQSIERDQAISELGLTPTEASAVLDPAGVDTQILEPTNEEEIPRRIGAYVGSILLYIAILVFGQFIMLGVMQEKQSRVVEVVLSRMRPERLLTGKILGIGMLALLQILIIGGALVGALFIVDIPNLDLSGIGVTIYLQMVLWFLLGFTLYAVLYGALGATVTRQEDAQGVAMLPVILLLPGYFISMISIENPDGLASVIASFVPFTAPLVMPVRAATGSVPLWQVAVAVALVVATTYLAIRIGARIYRGAVLSIGAKVKLREAFRSSEKSAA